MKIMNKRSYVSICLILMAFIVFVYDAKGQKNDNLSRTNQSWEVRLNKGFYFLHEPIFAHFETTLLGDERKPVFRYDASIKVTFQGETKDFGVLSRGGAAEELPNVILSTPGPGLNESRSRTFKSDEYIERVDELFPKAGIYEIQFFWHKPSGITASNSIQITIQEPTGGAEKQAFDFLNKNENPISFNWIWKRKDGVSNLENFVARYSESVYGEAAIRYLANVYKARGEIDKAQVEFEKLRSSKNKPFSDEAEVAISEIAKIRREPVRIKQSDKRRN